MNRVFKALADPTRRYVLQLLKEGPMTAGEIADNLSIAKPTLSAHLAILREADLVGSEKQGTSITYWLNTTVLEEALLAFADTMNLGLRPHKPRARATRRT
jgi:DNA-binding transcriptional ArsR family regulator